MALTEIAAQSKDDPLTDYDAYVAVTSRSECKIRSKLDTYLEEDVLPRNSNFDMLSYWTTIGIKYPKLSNIARDILVDLITTIALESSFSTDA